ncbi:BMP family ABC transporter substrate-binding protein [Clostridium perfringens]|uniref:BMP family lipoprotein n=1 Tax=Clostridium perfringens TaxID=1502 RepID=UPI001D223E81|nr:BMP family ABC transporter substrate-binding protein [Clostridium perfringens]EHK2348732.1 BMP family ABC transporter substrate-binding protein [Clostridium perfringens]MCX0374250.1 BMP family ABC transporter substrate-binding protein [Clostridium perfringens]
MKKKFLSAVLAVLTTATLLAGCGGSSDGQASSGDTGSKGDKMKVGMVTDAGTIDDKSFNQGTWEGIQKAEKDLGVEAKYLKPSGTTEADYLKEIGNLYDAGFKFIVTPGFKFETAIYKGQEKYKDAKFVLLDGAPHSGAKDAKPEVGPNTVSIFFAEEQAGFMAGVATALQLKEGQLGFIGGMEIPPVQKFNWGFQQGVAFANEKLGTHMSLEAKNVIYQGSFDDSAAGGQIAAQMYDNGVKAIFCAAGGVGVGAIQEAKNRAASGKEAWIIGVDVDQYDDGIYEGDKSVILTSAVKRIDHASYDMIKKELDGTFPGGQTLLYDAKNDGVGLPDKNPNLSEETMTEVNKVFEQLKSGEIKVSNEQGDLIN